MSLFSKSKQNYECANRESLFENFDVATSRLYYSLLLSLKNEIIINGFTLTKTDGTGTHINIFTTYWNSLQIKQSKKAIKERTKYNTINQQFRDLRVKADYHDEEICEKDYNDAQKCYSYFDSIVKQGGIRV